MKIIALIIIFLFTHSAFGQPPSKRAACQADFPDRSLPNELLEEVLGFLPFYNLAMLNRVNGQYNRAITRLFLRNAHVNIDMQNLGNTHFGYHLLRPFERMEQLDATGIMGLMALVRDDFGHADFEYELLHTIRLQFNRRMTVFRENIFIRDRFPALRVLEIGGIVFDQGIVFNNDDARRLAVLDEFTAGRAAHIGGLDNFLRDTNPLTLTLRDIRRHNQFFDGFPPLVGLGGQGQVRLRTLNLERVHFAQLPVDYLREAPALTELNIQGTALNELNGGMFINNRQLTHINFANNRLTELPPNIFRHTPLLTHINFANNRLTELPYDIFLYTRNLRQVDLRGNQLTMQSENYSFVVRTLILMNIIQINNERCS